MRNLAICSSSSRSFPHTNISNAAYDVETENLYFISEKDDAEVVVDVDIFKLDYGGNPEVSFTILYNLSMKLS